MSDTETTAWDTPRIEVRIYREGSLVQSVLCESDVEAAAVVDAWAEVEGVVCQVDDLAGRAAAAGVLDPRPWEVDADDASYESVSAYDMEGDNR